MSSWINRNLAGLFLEGPDAAVVAKDLLGGQSQADLALARLTVTGYAQRRSRVSPVTERGATMLSPYIRHGLLTLQEVYDAVSDVPAKDRDRYVDELLWQEYSRHLYNHVGPAMRSSLRYDREAFSLRDDERPVELESWADSPMVCLRRVEEELQQRGWIVNQTRMWYASHWAVRCGRSRVSGEDHFFRHLLDGSRSANGLGWQWVSGEMTGKVYGFSRSQVERQAPDWCSQCSLAASCPIENFPPSPTTIVRKAVTYSKVSEDLGPADVQVSKEVNPSVIWLTGEFLSLRQGALVDYPELPVAFIFDRALLQKLQLSSKRLSFLLETLAEISIARELEVYLGHPIEALAGRPIVTTWTPVPGWKRYSEKLCSAVIYPWPWLVRSHGVVSLNSYSAWRSSSPLMGERSPVGE
ncbi:MAG: FAD-binding domain-containing protein [Acidimicrobiales bacterium]